MASDARDRIHIRDLEVRCILGVLPEERREKQDVVINITLYADLAQAGATDSIEDTVDYKCIKKAVLAAAEQSSYRLLEALAEKIAAVCLQDEKVARVVVSVDKPGALRFAQSVAVEIERSRPQA
ncbi:MAG TPA: dihydroneopterin aldolase [Planctomycetes bacterium]|nr:dihydroneopterin aldolase [Planctomycetota bacterium]